MKIIYRISDAGYNKIKPNYIDNEKCLANAVNVFKDADWSIIADNVSEETNNMIQKYKSRDYINYVSVGHGAGTFNLALDEALTYKDDEIIYFIENDYLHKSESYQILKEGSYNKCINRGKDGFRAAFLRAAEAEEGESLELEMRDYEVNVPGLGR